MKEEIWKDVVCYEGLYQVSDRGQIRSCDKFKFNRFKHFLFNGRMLKQRTRPKGYKDVSLHKDGSSKPILVHRIVAEAFIRNGYKKPYVNHINANKSDNQVENLEWCTPKENGTHAKNNGLYKPLTRDQQLRVSKWCVVNQSKPVIQYDLNGNEMAEFPSAQEAQRKLGIRQGLISGVCRGEKSKTHNYVFKYKMSN